MTTIKSIFRQYGNEYIQKNGIHMPVVQKKAISAITRCRSPHFGVAVFQCDKCNHTHTIFKSCGNRHCPGCQHGKQHQWLNKRIEKQLPGHHFMVTFTVPEQIRHFIYRNQKVAYDAMFKASANTIKTLAADNKYIGGDLPGFFGALHTWGTRLQYHPHIHYVVAGGAYCKNSGQWRRSRIDFLLPVRAMSKIFKAKFKDRMIAAGLFNHIPSTAWEQAFNVDCRAVASGARSVTYLSKYLFKVAISDRRIVKIDDTKVYFKYRVENANRWRTTSLGTFNFIGRFLQHVLPKGFVKIRYFGLCNPNCSVSIKAVSLMIEMAYDFSLPADKPDSQPLPDFTCPHCRKGSLFFIFHIIPPKMGHSGFG